MKFSPKKVTFFIVNVLVVLIIIFGIFFVNEIYTAKKNGTVSSLLGFSPLVVLTNSMMGNGSQNFSAGDLLVLKKSNDLDFKTNDIIAFWDIIEGKKKLNTHRIVEINKDLTKYVTKGDNNPNKDEGFRKKSDIVGIYVFHIKGAGKALDFVGSKWGFLFCLVIPLAILFIWRLIKLIKVFLQYKKSDIE